MINSIVSKLMNESEITNEIKSIFVECSSDDIWIENNNASIEIRTWSEEIIFSLSKIQKLIYLFQLKTDYLGFLINKDDLIINIKSEKWDYEGLMITIKIVIKHSFIFEKENWKK